MRNQPGADRRSPIDSTARAATGLAWRAVAPEALGLGEREYVRSGGSILWCFDARLGGSASNGELLDPAKVVAGLRGLAKNLAAPVAFFSDVRRLLVGATSASVMQATFETFTTMMPELTRITRCQAGVVPDGDWAAPYWASVNAFAKAPWPLSIHVDAAEAWAALGVAPEVAAEIDTFVRELLARPESDMDALVVALRTDPHLDLLGAAKRLGISTRSLQRTLAGDGTTFADVRTRVRLDSAIAMLSRPDLKIAAVADAVGFTSTSHFAAWFRRHHGITPSELRARPSGRA